MDRHAIGDLFALAKGRKAVEVYSESAPGASRYIQIEDLRTDNDLKYAIDPSGTTVAPEDICIAWDGANAGTVGYGLTGLIGSTIARLRPINGKRVFTPYIAKYLQSQFKALNQAATGATIPHVSRDKLLGLSPALPEYSEQRRIAAILDKADGIQKKRREALMLADDFLRSVFLDMFGDPTTNPKGFPIQPLGNLSEVRTGATPSRDRPDYYGGDIPWVKTGEVDEDLIVDAEERITASAIAETNCKVFPVGTILVAMYGQGKTRGKCGVLGIPAATNQACAAVMPTDSISNSYLFYLLRASYETIRAMGRGGNQENLNLGMIKNIGIPIPPSALQNRFSDIAMAVSRNKAHQKSSLQEAMSLFASVSASAFNGKI